MNFLEPILFSPVEKTLLFIMGIKKKKACFSWKSKWKWNEKEPCWIMHLEKLLREEKASVTRCRPFADRRRLSAAPVKFQDTVEIVWHCIHMLLGLSLDTECGSHAACTRPCGRALGRRGRSPRARCQVPGRDPRGQPRIGHFLHWDVFKMDVSLYQELATVWIFYSNQLFMS